MIQNKTYLIKVILFIILISLSGYAQNEKYPVKLTPQLLDTLRYEGNYENSDLSVYDVAGYNRVYRINTPLGGFKSYNIDESITGREEPERPGCTINQTYKFRIGGFKRGNLFNPNQIGKIFSANHVDYTDGPGNDLYESLMICKKYGLQHYFYAPDYYDLVSSSGWTVATPNMKILKNKNSSSASAPISLTPIRITSHKLDLPFLNSDIDRYKKAFKNELSYMKSRLKDFSNLFPEKGGLFEKNYYNDPEMMCLLFAGGDLTPIDFFWNNVEKNYSAVNKEFKEKYGFNLPLMLKPKTPLEKAHRISFWNWVRKKYTSVMKLRADIFQKEISGKGILVSNVHFDTQVDFPLYGEAFDYPGFAIRPQMTDNPLDWKYLVGYGTRLTVDLCKKLPMISVRTNLAAAGSRIVPTPHTIKYWYTQAVRNGCAGFYLWEQDFPSYKGAYSGPNIGNPDSSSLPVERWETHLEMAKKLSDIKIFVPPRSGTAILVSLDANALGNYGWKKTFSAYVDLSKAKIWMNFIADQAIKENIDSLSEYKVVYIPFMEFESRDVVKKIMEYVANGGTIVCGDPSVFSYDLKGKSMTKLRQKLFGVEKISPRINDSEIKMNRSFNDIVIRPYSKTIYNLNAEKAVDIIGKYTDGKPAVTLKNYGRGKAILFGIPFFDIYLYSNKPDFHENFNRYKFLQKIANLAGTKDLSWIWNININNISEVTGKITTSKFTPLQSIKFRRYLR